MVVVVLCTALHTANDYDMVVNDDPHMHDVSQALCEVQPVLDLEFFKLILVQVLFRVSIFIGRGRSNRDRAYCGWRGQGERERERGSTRGDRHTGVRTRMAKSANLAPPAPSDVAVLHPSPSGHPYKIALSRQPSFSPIINGLTPEAFKT